MAFVYILRSLQDDRLYIGSTVDLSKRLSHHQGGWTYSTRRFGRIELVFAQEYTTLMDARRMERKLKRMKRRDYLEKIIKDGYIKMGR